jgi:hypothetical protein
VTEPGATAEVLTLGDLLALPRLGARLLTDADGADVPVRWAHSTELLDPRPYLSGGELVLTVGSSLRTDAQCHAFVEHLVAAGAAALGYGVGDVTPEVPGALLRCCRDLGLPLVAVAHGVPFQAVTELLSDHRSQARVAGDRRVQELVNRRRETGLLLDLVVARRADVEVLREALAAAGVPASRPVVVAAWPAGSGAVLAERLASALVADTDAATISITAGDPGEAALSELDLPRGTAPPCPVDALPSAVPLALSALELSRRRGVPVGHRDLVTFPGLLELQAPERLAPFSETLVAPLDRHDQDHGTALLATLRAFLDGDGSVSLTAAALFLHPNSLRHRLRRISELTGCDPRSFDDRVALAVGLWAWDRQPRDRRPPGHTHPG